MRAKEDNNTNVPDFAKTYRVPVKRTAPSKVSSAFISVENFAAGSRSGETRSALAKASNQTDIAMPNTSYIPPPISPLVAYQLFTQDAYHARAMKFIANCVGGIGYNIVPLDSDMKDYDKDEEYIKLKNFCDTPNEEGDQMEDLCVNAVLEFCIFGYSYFEVVPDLKGELAEIYNLRAINTFAKLYYKSLFYVQRVRGIDTYFRKLDSDAPTHSDANEVLAFQNYNPATKYYGLPDWYSATGDLVLSRQIVEYRLKRFDNNMFIQFIIICEGGELDDGAIEDIKKFMASNYKGVSNAGKVLYLNSNYPDVKIRIERIDSDMAESGFIQTRDQSVNYVSVAHGVAPILMGAIIKGQLGATTAIKDLFKIFNETIAKPRKRYFQKKLNHLFRTKLGITKFKFEFQELTIETFKDMIDYVTRAVPAGIITADEARKEIGYEEPLQELDPLAQLQKLSKDLRELKKQLTNV